MAAALAKVIRRGRFGASSQAMGPAILRRGPQEGVVPLLPHLASSPAAPAAGMGRLMHTGQWLDSVSGSIKFPEAKALPFGRRGVLSQEQNLVRMEQFSSKRAQEGGVPLLPHLGSSPAASAAGMGRLMHTGQCRNSVSGSIKLPEQKALPFGRRGTLSQEQKLVRMEQYLSVVLMRPRSGST